MSYNPGKYGFVSVNNSSSTPLTSSATFTGTGEIVQDYASVSIFVYSDVSGTMYMDFSTDGTNWDRPKMVKNVSNSVHTLAVIAKYFRVRYVNDGVGQSSFRLQTIYHTSKNKPLTSTKKEIVSDQNDVLLTRDISDHKLDLKRGLLGDQSVVHKFGENPLVGTSWEDVWENGGTYPFQLVPIAIRVKSGGNVADIDTTGTGARKIIVEGLDGSFNEISDTIALNGTSVSLATSNTYMRIQRAYVSECGTYGGTNTGAIEIETTGGVVLAHINPTIGQTEMSQFTVPAGKTAYLTRLKCTVASTKACDVEMFQRAGANVVSAPFTSKRIIHEFLAVDGNDDIIFDSYIKFTEYTDLWLAAKAVSGTSGVSVNYDLIISDNG